MKLYDFPPAPNPRRLRIYLAEKGLAIPTVQVNLLLGEQKTPEFLARNPLGQLPVLELDDGSMLTESGAIIEYLEELHPDPPLLGTSPLERAHARRLSQHAIIHVLGPGANYFHATLALLPGVEKDPARAEACLAELPKGLDLFEAALATGPWIAGERVTVGDCTLFATFLLTRAAGLELEAVGSGYPRLARWFEEFSRRPSAEA